MKKLLILPLGISIGAMIAGCESKSVQTADYGVVPLPREIVAKNGTKGFVMDSSTKIVYPVKDSTLRRYAEFLSEYVREMTGLNLKVTDKKPSSNYVELMATLDNSNPEGYKIDIDGNKVVINGSTQAGVFYGIQTLRKSIPEQIAGNVEFPSASISDEPRFPYRGAHLDVSRHFFPVDSVKRFIDMLALHNINNFHWHISDDQGWRIEIKRRPLLTELGSMRDSTVVGRNFSKYDGKPYGGFYTQDEAREIVKYASYRNINVIPEIDMPGHMQGSLKAYPNLGCTGGPYEVWGCWGISDEVLCAGNDSTYAFIDDVLEEITQIFPSEIIHIGGDECPKDSWQKCAKCQAKIAELGFKTDADHTKEERLQSHFMSHAVDFLTKKGRTALGWDEILEGGIADGAMVMSWRGEEGGITASKMGHDVVMVPTSHLYFDYYQTENQDSVPLAIGGYVPLSKVYGYNPVPEELTADEAKHIKGVQANLWTEYIPNYWQVEYMELPRMSALSEVQWTSVPKDWEGFLKRLEKMKNHYKAQGYHYSPTIE